MKMEDKNQLPSLNVGSLFIMKYKVCIIMPISLIRKLSIHTVMPFILPVVNSTGRWFRQVKMPSTALVGRVVVGRCSEPSGRHGDSACR